jgi:hypothetical protein
VLVEITIQAWVVAQVVAVLPMMVLDEQAVLEQQIKDMQAVQVA